MKKIFTFLCAIFLFVATNAQTPELVWAKTFGNKSAATDSTSLIKINAVENATYIAGTSDAWGKGNDIVLIKRNIATGDTIWTRHYNGPANGDDQVADFVINPTTGDIYVTGKSMGNGTGYDVVTLKYQANGNIVWQNRWDNSDYHGDDIPKNIGIDSNETIHITGSTFNGNDKLNDLLLLRYDKSASLKIFATNLFDYISGFRTYYSNDNAMTAKVNNLGQTFVVGEYLIGTKTNGVSVVFARGIYDAPAYSTYSPFGDIYSDNCVGWRGYTGFPKGNIQTPDDFNYFNAMDIDNSNNVYFAYLKDTIYGIGNGYAIGMVKINSSGCTFCEKNTGKSSNAKDLSVKSL